MTLYSSITVTLLAVLFPVAAWADLSGTQTLSANNRFSFDTGATVACGGDILFTGSSITMQGSATAFGSLGSGATLYSSLTQATLSSFLAAYSSAPLSSLSVNQVIAVHTIGGNFAKILITAVSSTSLSVQYTTFGVSGGGGVACGSGSILASTYGTYFGGSGSENGIAVTTDSQGNVIIVGTTTSQTLPGTTNAFQPMKDVGFPNNQNVFIAKFDPTGRTLLWATFLGGDTADSPNAVSVDQSGNIFVIGRTSSSNFPTTGYISCTAGTVVLQQVCSMAPAGNASGFVAKISPDGSKLLYSIAMTDVFAIALAVDGQGTAYIAGESDGEMYLLHLDASGTQIMFGTFLGGGSIDVGLGGISSVVLDAAGNAWVAGYVLPGGISLQTTPNSFQAQQSNSGLTNGANGFILQLNSAGSQVLYGTYFGPRYANTWITGVVVSSDGSVYFDGYTDVASFQATPGAYLGTPGTGNYFGYVAKLTPGATVLDAFSYLPSTPLGLTLGSDHTLRFIDAALSANSPLQYVVLATPDLALVGVAPTFNATNAIALAQGVSSNMEWLVGSLGSMSNVVTPDAFQSVLSGPSDAFLQQITMLSGIIIQTNPAGLQISVDGGTLQTAPLGLNLTPGSHTIAVPTIQAIGAGAQFVFTDWSDGGAASHSINVTSSAATYTASFTEQYQLAISTLSVGSGTVTPASGGFYDSGSVVPVTATANSGYTFAGWIGPVASTPSASTTVTMSGPQSVTASFALTGHPAAVTNVTSSTPNGTYGTPTVISIQVSFSGPVTVTGIPQLALNSGGTAYYSSGSGSTTLNFTYAIGASDSNSHLDYTSTSALTLNGGAIKDAAGNNANLTLPAPGAAGSLGANASIWIGTTGPVPAAFFTGEVYLGSGVYFLQFPNGTLFGYYNFPGFPLLYHYDMGFEYVVPANDAFGDVYFYDFQSGHWWYTGPTLFPNLYDFTLGAWIFYFSDPSNPGHYTTNPRKFAYDVTHVTFTM